MPLFFLILSGLAVAAMAAVGSSRRITMRAGEVWTLHFSIDGSAPPGTTDAAIGTAILSVLSLMPGLSPTNGQANADRTVTVVVRPTSDVTIDLGQSLSIPVLSIRITLQEASRASAQ